MRASATKAKDCLAIAILQEMKQQKRSVVKSLELIDIAYIEEISPVTIDR